MEIIKTFLIKIENYIKDETVSLDHNCFILTNKGKLLADKIAGDLFQ